MLSKSQFKANTPKAYQQYSPDYGWRLYRLSSANLSKSQIRGHARPSERSVKELRAESKRTGFDFLRVPRRYDQVTTRWVTRKNRTNDKFTTYVEFAGDPTFKSLVERIHEGRARGFNVVRIIRGSKGTSKTTQWLDINPDYLEATLETGDPYVEEGYGTVYSLAFTRLG